MGEINKLLRLLVQGDVEGKITKFTAVGDPRQVTSQLGTDNTRKAIAVYNNSDASSGDCFYGFHSAVSPSGEHQQNAGQPIPVGAQISIPVANSVDVYICSVSGEEGDLRIEEIA